VFFVVPVFPSRLTPLADGRFGTTFPQEPDDPVARNANLAKKNEINAATKDISGSLFCGRPPPKISEKSRLRNAGSGRLSSQESDEQILAKTRFKTWKS